MKKPTHILAVAGATSGSTALLASLADPRRAVKVRGEGIMPLEMNLATFKDTIKGLVGAVLDSYENAYDSFPDDITAVFGLSSLTPEHMRGQLHEAANSSKHGLLFTTKNQVNWIHRAEACLYAANEHLGGLVVKGGSIGFAHYWERDPAGKPLINIRIGGWGLFSGDDGGGYQIGREGLYRLFEELDQREKSGRFGSLMHELMGGDATLPDLISWVSGNAPGLLLRKKVAELARSVIYLAESQQCEEAEQLLLDSATVLARSTMIVVKRVPDDKPNFGSEGLRLVLHGGLIQNSTVYAQAYCQAIKSGLDADIYPEIQFIPLVYTPAIGCLLYALRQNLEMSADEATTYLKKVHEFSGIRLGELYKPAVQSIFKGEKR